MRQLRNVASLGDQSGSIDSCQIFPANFAPSGAQIPLHELHVMSMCFGWFMFDFPEVDHDSLVAVSFTLNNNK